MINACVSHELRNPLNSIAAQNSLKDIMYGTIYKIISDCESSLHQITQSDLCLRLKDIMAKLSDGQNIQESSVNIMASVIQNMMDYGQIKSGKFRKNFKNSNIRDTINKVVSIQKR